MSWSESKQFDTGMDLRSWSESKLFYIDMD